MQISSHLLTDVGRVRKLNEDNIRIVPSSEAKKETLGDLYILADGMGGHEAGEVASQLAVETIAEHYYESSGPPTVALRESIEEANRAIYQNAQEEDRHGMGTTVVAAAVVGDILYSAHVGDSRLYLIRGGDITQLTRDHSLVAEQIEAGLISPEEAALHPHRNIISRAVGTAPHVEVELPDEPLRLREGDIVLICSDGLTEHVPAERIEQLIRNRTLEEAAQSLIDAANAAGGSDNISVILVQAGERVESPPATTATAPTMTAPETTQKKEASRQRVPLAAWLLLFILAGGIGGWYLLTYGPFSAAPGVAELATATPERTATSRSTRTPRATTTLALSTPTLEPSATPPTSTVLSTVLTPSIVLLAPAPGTITSTTTITFSAVISDLSLGDEVQLRLGQSVEARDFIFQGLRTDGTSWSIALTEPPNGTYGLWYWSIVVVSTATGNRLVYQVPARDLTWEAPAPSSP